MQNVNNLVPSIITYQSSLVDYFKPIIKGYRVFILIMSLSLISITGYGLFSKAYESEGLFRFGGAIPATSSSDEGERENEKPKDWENSTDPLIVNDFNLHLDSQSKKNPNNLGIPFAYFKRFSSVFSNVEHFKNYLNEKGLNQSASYLKLLNKFNNGEISRIITPIFPITKLDTKELSLPPINKSYNVVGVKIKNQSSSAEEAQQMTLSLGKYIIDSIVFQTYYDTLHFRPNDLNGVLTSLDNRIIQSNALLALLERKVANLKRIIAKYKIFPKSTGGQEVVVTNADTTYLSPDAQLIATEVKIAMIRESLLNYQRDRSQAKLLLEYYLKVQGLVKETKSGETMLRGLETAKDLVFKSKDFQDDAVKEVYNTVSLENSRAISLYFEKSRFIAGPSLPNHSTFRPLRILALSIILGLSLSLVVIYSRKWWEENSEKLFV